MFDRLTYADSRFTARAALTVALTGVLGFASRCSASDDTPPGATCSADGGGPVAGMGEDLCMGTFQEVGMCTTGPEDGGGMDTDAGAEPLPDPSVGTEN